MYIVLKGKIKVTLNEKENKTRIIKHINSNFTGEDSNDDVGQEFILMTTHLAPMIQSKYHKHPNTL